MKLVRYGARRAERPGLLDAEGGVRDISGVVADIAGHSGKNSGISAEASRPMLMFSGTPTRRKSVKR